MTITSFSDLDSCPICDAVINVGLTKSKVYCSYCSGAHSVLKSCKNEHYICDFCFDKSIKKLIMDYCLKSISTNANEMATELMKHPNFPNSGTEHTFLLVAVLISAYCNIIHDNVLKEKMIADCEIRSFELYVQPNGYFGPSSIGLATGIFLRVLMDHKPIANEETKLCNLVVAQTLSSISDYSLTDCDKRSVYLSISETGDFLAQFLDVFAFQYPDIKCTFSKNIETCNKKFCRFYQN